MHVISAWFYRKRGLAIGLVMAGTGLGYAYVPVLVRYVIDAYSWRAAYLVLAAIIAFIALPLVYLWMRESPRELGLRPDGDPPDAPTPAATSRDVGLELTGILRRREFWILVSVLIVLSFALHGLLAHLVPMLVDRGMSSATAASVAAVEGVTVMLARVLVGHLMDRFFAPRVAMTFFVLSALGLVAFATGAVDGLAFARRDPGRVSVSAPRSTWSRIWPVAISGSSRSARRSACCSARYSSASRWDRSPSVTRTRAWARTSTCCGSASGATCSRSC